MDRMKNKCQIGWRRYAVCFVDQPRDYDGTEAVETHESRTSTIDVMKGLADDELEIILHGIVHALMRQTGRYKFSDFVMDGIAMNVAASFKQSPKFWRELLDTYT